MLMFECSKTTNFYQTIQDINKPMAERLFILQFIPEGTTGKLSQFIMPLKLRYNNNFFII
jgi:hypothetical protein